jgi:hypothetical protein
LEQRQKVAARVEVYQVATLFRCVVVVSMLLNIQKSYTKKKVIRQRKRPIISLSSSETIKQNYWKTQCVTYRGEEKCIDDFGEETRRRGQLKDLGIDGQITLKWASKK